MDKDVIGKIGKCLVFGVIWALILFVVAVVITKATNFTLKDVLFVEGILFVLAGVMASIGGNSMGLSLQGLGQNNAQYTANANLEVAKMERERTSVKTTISMGLSTVALIIGGVLVIILNFII